MEAFDATVGRWVSETKERTVAVFKQSAQDVLEDAQRPVAKGGRMRVLTGFLRNSHVSGLNGSTSLSGADSYILTIAKAQIGDAITGGWTASYAAPREAKDFFLRGAAQKWQRIVDKNARKAQGSR